MHLAKRSTLVAILACAAVTASTGAIVDPASAAETPARTIVQKNFSTGAVAATSNYWTPTRMAAASSARFVDDDPDGGNPPGTDSPSLRASDRVSASIHTVSKPHVNPSAPEPGFAPNQHLGVVFFRAGGIDQRCTGNAVVSDSGNTVATSGRCVSALAGQFVTQLAFVPGFNGSAPHGVWPAHSIVADTRWVNDRQVDFDSAFFVVKAPTNRPTTTLSSTVGASGVDFSGQEDGDDFRVTGYRTDGSDPRNPTSTVSDAEPNPWMGKDYAIEGLEWDARGGVSGSPWVDADAEPIKDVECGMTSFAYKQFLYSSFGPQWTGSIRDLYETAAATL